jgi:hypothetical protein
MLSNGKELLGELYGRDHLTYEEIEDLDLRVVTEKGERVSAEELRGKIFRIVDRDEPSGYVVHDPLLPSSVLFVGAAGCLGARLPLLLRPRTLQSDGVRRTLPAMEDP